MNLFNMLFIMENIYVIPVIKMFSGIVLNFVFVFSICDGGYSVENKVNS